MNARMSRRLFAGALAAGVTLGTVASANAAERLIFATQQSGTMYYTLATGFSKMLTGKLGRKVAVQPYSGSSVYLPLINSGEATLAFSSSLDAYAGYNGTDRKALKNMRAVARIWPLKVALMARDKAGIKTIADLKGKRVVIDFKGQKAMGMVIRAMMATGGLTEKDVKGVTVGSVVSGNKALIEGNVDVTFIAVGIPLVKRAHAAIPGGVNYVDLAGGNVSPAFLASKAGGVYPAKLAPAKRMPEVTKEITIAAFDIFLLTSAKTSDADVKAVLAAVSDNFVGLQKDYPPLRRGRADKFAAATNTLPYHKAAIAYYKAKGMWTPANDAAEKTFK
ncbi:MAG TPA: TAXI family TRAP transporter solute-binding subunit [Alphaproteobacteria bacterium]|nr:TAXI family TRAP transporter solute-binding subunit [Alphaproteobacteria bacterium]